MTYLETVTGGEDKGRVFSVFSEDDILFSSDARLKIEVSSELVTVLDSSLIRHNVGSELFNLAK